MGFALARISRLPAAAAVSAAVTAADAADAAVAAPSSVPAVVTSTVVAAGSRSRTASGPLASVCPQSVPSAGFGLNCPAGKRNPTFHSVCRAWPEVMICQMGGGKKEEKEGKNGQKEGKNNGLRH